jgi:hypothetical protein
LSNCSPEKEVFSPDPVCLPLLLLIEHVQEGSQLSIGKPAYTLVYMTKITAAQNFGLLSFEHI